jgi:hypothetical protein
MELNAAGLDGPIKDDMAAMEIILRSDKDPAPTQSVRDALALVTSKDSKMSRPMTYFPVLVHARNSLMSHLRKISADEQFTTKLKFLRDAISGSMTIAGRDMPESDLMRFRSNLAAIQLHTSPSFQIQNKEVLDDVDACINKWIQDALASRDAKFDALASDVFQAICLQSSRVIDINDDAAANAAVEKMIADHAILARMIPTIEGTELKMALTPEQLQKAQIVHLARMKFFDNLSAGFAFVMVTHAGLATTGGLAQHNAASVIKLLDTMDSDDPVIKFQSHFTNTAWQMCVAALRKGVGVFQCDAISQFVNDHALQFVASQPFLEPSTYQTNALVPTDESTINSIAAKFDNNLPNLARTKTKDFMEYFEKQDTNLRLKVATTDGAGNYSMDNGFLAAAAPLFWKVWVPLVQLHARKATLLQMESPSYDVKALAIKKGLVSEALP